MSSPSFDLRSGVSGEHPGPDAAIHPRSWQRSLIQLLRARIHTTDPERRDVLVHAGPGAGKTLGALLGFRQLQREGHLEHCVICCHRSSIARQWLDAAQRLGLELRELPSPEVLGQPHPRPAGWLLSYQGALRHQPALQKALAVALADRPWLAIADEVHHLGLDPDPQDAMADASGWGQVFAELSAGACLRLGLTGTPFRADRLAFCAARRVLVREGGEISERIVPDLCVEPHQLICSGDVRPLQFRFQDGWVDHGRDPGAAARETSPLSQEARESWRARNLRRAIQPGAADGIAQRILVQARCRLETVRRAHAGAAGLVVARDIQHAERIASLLREEGESVQLVHSQDPAAVACLEAFRGGDGRWLVSVDMCAEGFDAPRIRVVVYLTTVVTRSRFVQAITRAVRLDAARAALEGVPRDPSFVYAPADPLLIDHARSWSLSGPYELSRAEASAEADGSVGLTASGVSRPLLALADGAGSMIRMRGPELPAFLGRRPA